MFMWKTLLFKKKTHKKDQKKNDSHSNTPPPSSLTRSSSPSSSRLKRSSSIHHSKCFDYVVPGDLASEYQRMNESSSNETGSSHGAQQPSRESPRGPIFQDSCKAGGSINGKNILDEEPPCQTLPKNVTSENEVSSKQKNTDDSAHQSKEFSDFLELFNAHRELFLKILQDPSLLVPPEQQEQEASSSGGVPMSKLQSFPRPGGSSGKRNPIFDRNDSEQSRRPEIQRSPSRPKADLEGTKVISTRIPSGVEASTVSLVESRSLKKNGTTSNRFKAISKKIKDVVKDNRRELARITKDGVFHKMPYGQKMAELTKTTSTKKFVQEGKQIRRSYSIAESVDKYSTLYESMSRDSKTFPERPSTSTAKEDGASLYDKKSPMHMKRITSLPEMHLYSPHRDSRIEVSDSQTIPKTNHIEPANFSSCQNGSFHMYPEGNYYPDDICSEQNDGESAYLGSLEEDLRSVLRTPSLCSFAQSFSHRRINSLPSFDRSFIQDHNYSFTEHSVADSEPTFEHMQLEDDEWLVTPSHLSGEYAAKSKDDEWLIRPLQPSSIDVTGHEDEGWVIETPHLLGANAVKDEEWLVNPAQPSSVDGLNSELCFLQENDTRSWQIYVNDKNEADFQYVKDILKKSGFSCGDADWYATNQPVSPVIFEEAECQDLDTANDEPHSIDRRMLLFDIINEVLMHIYDSSLINGPWHSRFDPRTRPIPMGSHVLEEVWANVSCYLSLQWKPNHTVDDVVAYDFMRKDNWMNLLYDVECAALDVEDLMVEDLLDDVVLQIVLISIDE